LPFRSWFFLLLNRLLGLIGDTDGPILLGRSDTDLLLGLLLPNGDRLLRVDLGRLSGLNIVGDGNTTVAGDCGLLDGHNVLDDLGSLLIPNVHQFNVFDIDDTPRL
jgi:hypothetical protein